jgi:hypothetical protein
MATMLPPVAPSSIAVDSERLVYEALSRLPSAYTVMHSYPWLRPGRDDAGTPLREGEADFLVLHPERGLLVLEVKGGDPVLRGRAWYRGQSPIRDPFDQARRNRYALLDAVEERTKRGVARDQFTHGDVVVFPHHIYRGDLPHNVRAETLLDASSLGDIEPRLIAAYSAWDRGAGPLTAAAYTGLINALLPKLRLIRCVGADIQSEARRLVQLSEDQRATLLGLLASPRVLIEGVAGSGKTLLALEFAVSVAERGESALVLCFNRHLADWMHEQVLVEPRLAPAKGSVHIHTFHHFAFDLAARAGVDFDVPKGDASRFWDEEAPMLIEQAIEVLKEAGRDPRYDVVIVDEGQDFLRDWWITVESLVRGGSRGPAYVFMDLHQSLRGSPERPSIALPARFSLNVNCRNTRSIALSGARVVEAKVRTLPGSPEGEEPALRRANAQAAQAGLVMAEVKDLLGTAGLLPSQIAVIGPASHSAGSLSGRTEIAGIPITTDAAKWRSGQGVIVTTSRAFKGLEADVVVLYDLSGFSDRFTRADLYVAWTRAKHRLIVVCHGAEVRAEIERALQEIHA